MNDTANEEARPFKAMMTDQPLISDHALAAADLLAKVVDRLHAGTAPEDLGWDVERIGRMMARRI